MKEPTSSSQKTWSCDEKYSEGTPDATWRPALGCEVPISLLRAYVAETIDGRRGIRAHGTRDMPLWGRRFGHEIGPGPGQSIEIRGRIYLLAEYLRSIQK
jgi:hypothetical protein